MLTQNNNDNDTLSEITKLEEKINTIRDILKTRQCLADNQDFGLHYGQLSDFLDQIEDVVNPTENTVNEYISLEQNTVYKIPLGNGVLCIEATNDPLYPGVDIEFVPNNESSDELVTRPRILIEAPLDPDTNEYENLRALVWGRADSEDYTDKITFDNKQLSKH